MDIKIDLRDENNNISCGVAGISDCGSGASYCVWVGGIEMFLTYSQFSALKEAINETKGK